jgi:type I restriction enzyme R subunit
MKQAIEEGFIKDVLANYTPVQSWYKLAKTVDGRPAVRREASATKKLRKFVEGQARRRSSARRPRS